MTSFGGPWTPIWTPPPTPCAPHDPIGHIMQTRLKNRPCFLWKAFLAIENLRRVKEREAHLILHSQAECWHSRFHTGEVFISLPYDGNSFAISF